MAAKSDETLSRGNVGKEALRKEVTKNVRALLISAPNGLTVAEMQRDYNTMIKKPLPFRELGFKTPIDLLKDLPNVTRPTWENGVLVLRGESGVYVQTFGFRCFLPLPSGRLSCLFMIKVDHYLE